MYEKSKFYNKTPVEILQQYWGFSSFRPLQEQIINSVLHSKNTLTILPTGGGKSICYQVPAMMREGFCLVISPLIALMKDQVENLRKKGITAFSLHAGMTRKEVEQTLITATDSNCKFLYVSPERLESALFLEYLPAMNINLIAVDEAHCISQWGYDFRPSYLNISKLKVEFPDIPILALTASATDEVQKDICDKLSISPEYEKDNWVVLKQSVERKNLSYSVFHSIAKQNKIAEILTKVPGSSIVYCKSRNRTKEIATHLQAMGFSADYYHAGLTQEERSSKQDAWIKNEINTIVCTNAFGMGIDKPDVRIVIHADSPDSLENYYQEAGRAGRDQQKAYAVLLFNEKDIDDFEVLSKLRFPDLETIRHVYQAIANYLQIPAFGGLNEYYDFDLSDFSKKFNLSSFSVLPVLKVLEQDGWISFNEQVFLPAKAGFVCNKEYLELFQQNRKDLNVLIQALLRAYEGIFDRTVSISEKQLCTLTKQSLEKVMEGLKALEQADVIEYQPQKDKPQLYFLRERVPTPELTINMAAYQKRKEIYFRRLEKMLDFVTDTDACRSVTIARYFNDNDAQPCGICDNCLKKKRKPISQEEFEKFFQIIKEKLLQRKYTIEELLVNFNTGQKEKIRQVIEHYQSEKIIQIDTNGLIHLTEN